MDITLVAPVAESHREWESRPRASVAPPTCTAPQQPGGTRGPSPAPSAKCRAQPRSQKRGPRPREERVFGPGRAVPPLTCEAAGSALGPQALLFCMGLCLRADGGPECPGPPEQEGSRRAERPGLPCPRARVKDSPLPGCGPQFGYHCSGPVLESSTLSFSLLHEGRVI